MPTIVLGNTAPIQAVKVDDESTAVERVARPDLGKTITTFDVPDSVGVGEALQTVSSVFASHHSDEKPAWVESDDEVVAQALSREFGCPVGRPNDWDAPVAEPAAETQTITAADVATVPAAVTEPAAPAATVEEAKS
jgi:hypothetical protein